MPIVTISRQLGSGGRHIGQLVAKALHYQCIERRRFLEDIDALGIGLQTIGKEYDEHYPDVWERHDRSFKAFVALNQSVVLMHALKDNVILIGRGGNFLLEGLPHVVRTRIVAPIEARIETIVKREGFSKELAAWLINKADKEMARTIRLVYGKDIDNPKEYDAIFDTSAETAHEVTGRIKQLVAERTKPKSEEAAKLLYERAVAAKVKAGILTHPKFLIATFDAVPGKGGIIIRGAVHNPKEYAQTEQLTRQLAGNVPVHNELHYR